MCDIYHAICLHVRVFINNILYIKYIVSILSFFIEDVRKRHVSIVCCSRRSRIFLKRRPLSCEVVSGSRRDSVGGGVVAEFFRGLQKQPARFSVPLMGPFYIFRLSQRPPPESATVL